MKYHELLELYKKKKLGEEQREMVEQDIERHEAIIKKKKMRQMISQSV